MMARLPEPELMTAADQVAEYAAADLSELHAPMLEHFWARFPGFRGGVLLDLGCGAADISIRFARAYPHVKVLGVDGSPAMLAAGRAAVERAGLSDRIELRLGHIPADDIAPVFDAVIANSLLHHLADPASLWTAAANAARTGAPVMVMDLRRPPDRHSAEMLVERYGAEARPLLRRDFFQSLCAAYTAGEVRTQLDSAGLASFDVAEIGDLHLLVWGEYRGKFVD